MQRYNNQTRNIAGLVVANPTVTVYRTGTLILATIYSDNGVTPLANPFTGAANGQYYFYAANGAYDIVLSGGTPTVSLTIVAERLEDDSGLVSGSLGITSLNGLTGDTQPSQSMVVGTGGSDFSIDSSGSIHTFNLPTASSTKNGKLQSTDWAAFNNKLGNLNGLVGQSQAFGVGTSGNDFNISSSGSSHTFNLPTASSGVRGALAPADFASFAAKQSALPVGTTSQYVRGDLVLATLNTSSVPESTNLYYTDARARAALGVTAPLSYNVATGAFSLPAATGTQNGYLTSSDWTTFNNKLSSTAVVSETKDSNVMVTDAALFVATATVTKDTSAAEQDVNTVTLAGALSANRVLRIHLAGSVRVSTGGADTFRIRIYLGGAVVVDTGAIDPVLATAFNYDGWFDLVIRVAGGAGTVQANGYFHFDDSTFIHKVINTNTTPVVLTGTPILKDTCLFSTSNATNQIKEEVFAVGMIN